ncbi:MAG TPA: hypothetical protein VFC53_13305 [Dehalococcoidia bacterium]|nr:hypothetical protein [Dehalococcoidia bacterium]
MRRCVVRREGIMLEHVDRVQLAVRDRAAAAEIFAHVFAGEVVADDEVRALAARRRTVRSGRAQFELLEPAGDGPVAAYVAEWNEGLFAGGFSTKDVGAVAARLGERGVAFAEEGGQLFIAPDQTPGLRMVISAERDESSPGLLRYLYEVTNLIDDHMAAAKFYSDTFGLDASRFSPINSREYGYTGQLTLFNPPERLDRIELSQITDWERPMGRFMKRRGGQTLYMCYAEADDLAPIVERLRARNLRFAPHDAAGNVNGIFVHPSALKGMLMGVSRTNVAWTWSGRPDLAPAGARAGH